MIDIHSIKIPAVSPSLLAADPARLVLETKKAENAKCPLIHIDVMDGRFVENVSFGPSTVASLSREPGIIKDTHIMIEEPYRYAKEYVLSGADILTFHYEACLDIPLRFLTIQEILVNGGIPGISIKPETPVSVLKPFFSKVGLILVMSVEPGKGGQSFIEDSLKKIKNLKEMLYSLPKKERPLIEVDGGINEITGPKCLAAGADILVAGSYLYGHDDFALRVKRLLGEKI